LIATGPSRWAALGDEFEPSPGFAVRLLEPSALRLVTDVDQVLGDLAGRRALTALCFFVAYFDKLFLEGDN
jgi:hypothetical protein